MGGLWIWGSVGTPIRIRNTTARNAELRTPRSSAKPRMRVQIIIETTIYATSATGAHVDSQGRFLQKQVKNEKLKTGVPDSKTGQNDKTAVITGMDGQ